MRSASNIEHTKNLPELGTAAAAVESCVSLIAGMCGHSEQIIHYWLDLYYQVRLAYDRQQAQEAEAHTVRLTPEVKRILQEWAADHEGEAPDPPAEAPAGDPQPDAPEGFEPVTPAAPAHKGTAAKMRGNSYSAEAARFKRETRERLVRLRAQGLTTARIVEEANGAISADSVHLIMDAMSVPVAVYRVLVAVLDKCEDQ